METNDNLNYIYDRFVENKLSHIFLIETNNIDSCYNDLINILKKIILEENDIEKDILYKMIDDNNLPDLYVIEPDGSSIKKDQIINLFENCKSKAAFINKKYYIIKHAEKITENCENRILKFIEEPENNIIGFLITDDYHKMLSTIISRCQILTIKYENMDNNGYIHDDLLLDYVNNLECSYSILNNKILLDNFSDRSEFLEFFQILEEIYNKLLMNINYFPGNKFLGGKKLSIHNICCRITLINEVLDMLLSNCNIEMTLNYFAIELGKINE